MKSKTANARPHPEVQTQSVCLEGYEASRVGAAHLSRLVHNLPIAKKAPQDEDFLASNMKTPGRDDNRERRAAVTHSNNTN